jgi:DNA-binding response OmpR family regulator
MSHKILVIDDEIETLTLLGILLHAAGYEVLTASSPAEGLKLADDHRPDLVLLDIMMPGMTGWEVCERLRQIAPMPIIFVTALRDAQSKSKGLLVGDDYIVKPFDTRELVQRVRAHIEPESAPGANPTPSSEEPAT